MEHNTNKWNEASGEAGGDRSSETRLRVETASPKAEVREYLREVSHEIRAPLANILAYASLIERGESKNMSAQGAEDLDAIAALARNALGMIDDILKAGYEQRETESRREIVSFVALTTRCEKQARGLIGDKPILLRTRVSPDAERGYTDPVKIEQIINNLLTNAARFTDDGCITVFVRRVGTTLEVEVRDTGIGIPVQDQEAIFERGRQVNAPGKDRGGTGLGLSIVERICSELRGEIGLESTVGRGSRFIVSLPDVFPLATL